MSTSAPRAGIGQRDARRINGNWRREFDGNFWEELARSLGRFVADVFVQKLQKNYKITKEIESILQLTNSPAGRNLAIERSWQ